MVDLPVTPVSGGFPRTRWTMIVSAAGEGPEARRALNELCALYWQPVYFFVRRRGHDHADAADLTQGFFADLLGRRSLEAVAQEKGRLRTFLLTALTRHMITQYHRRTAEKRGGGVPVLTLEFSGLEGRFVAEPGHSVTPELEFERQWALRLLDEALERTRQEAERRGRAHLFAELRGLISTDAATAPYAEIALRHGLSEASVKSAAHRLRDEFREALRSVIAETVGEESDIDEEITHLFRLFQVP